MALSDWLYKILRWILGGVFIYAGSIKLLDLKTFAVLIEAFGFLPESMLLPISVVIPVLEIVAGIGLVFDIKGSLSIYASLLGLFIAMLGYAIWMGLDVDCGCFGPEDPESEAFHGLRFSLIRDLIMLAGIMFLYGCRQYRAIEPLSTNIIKKGIPITKTRKNESAKKEPRRYNHP